jgi:hypothetical protein
MVSFWQGQDNLLIQLGLRYMFRKTVNLGSL